MRKLVCIITEVLFQYFWKFTGHWWDEHLGGFLGEVAVMSRHDGGTHLEWGVEGRGMKALSQIISDESLSYSLKHISTGEHSTFHGGALISYIYISCFHDDVIKWKHVPRYWLLCGEFTGDCGEFTGHREFSSHRPVTRSFDVFFDLRLNRQLSKQSRRRWLGRHRAHYDVIATWCRIVIQWSGQPWDLSAFNASLLLNFELVKRFKLGGSVHYGKMASNLAHCSTLITNPWI